MPRLVHAAVAVTTVLPTVPLPCMSSDVFVGTSPVIVGAAVRRKLAPVVAAPGLNTRDALRISGPPEVPPTLPPVRVHVVPDCMSIAASAVRLPAVWVNVAPLPLRC